MIRQMILRGSAVVAGMTNGMRLLCILLVAALLASVVAVTCPLLTTDTCCRYASMAEMFAAENWELSFHPRFDIGMPIAAGLTCWLTGLDGYVSCSLVAAIAWALAVVPIWGIANEVFDEKTAWMSVALYLVCPMLFVWALKGLREPFKVTGILLMTDAVLRSRSLGRQTLLEAICGLIFLVWFKVDSIAYAIFLTACYLFFSSSRVRALALVGWLVVVMQPCCWLVWDWTGYWLPAPQYVPFFNLLMGFVR